MISRGMPIQVRRCGTSVRVEHLSIGDIVYDPVRDNYLEIVDILSRDTTRLGNRLVRLSADSLTRNRPSSDLFISPQQIVGVPQKGHPAGHGWLKPEPACKLGEEVDILCELFAIFTENSGWICAAGVLLEVLDQRALLGLSQPLPFPGSSFGVRL